MNSKMTTNSQLSANEPKRKDKQRKQKTEQTSRKGTKSEKWTSQWRDFSGEGEGRNGGERCRKEA